MEGATKDSCIFRCVPCSLRKKQRMNDENVEHYYMQISNSVNRALSFGLVYFLQFTVKINANFCWMGTLLTELDKTTVENNRSRCQPISPLDKI